MHKIWSRHFLFIFLFFYILFLFIIIFLKKIDILKHEHVVFSSFSSDHCQQVVVICWALWRIRNDWLWNKKRGLILNVLFLALLTLDKWKQAQSKFLPQVVAFLSEADGAVRWLPPTEGMLKVNLDAAIFAESGSFNIACLARNLYGIVVDAFSKCRSGLLAPELAEALCFKEALR